MHTMSIEVYILSLKQSISYVFRLFVSLHQGEYTSTNILPDDEP